MQRSRHILIATVVAIPVVVLAVLAWSAGRSDGRIADGVSVQGLPVGGMTTADARAQLVARFQKPTQRPIEVRVSGGVFRFDPKEAGVQVDVDRALKSAREAGEEGGFVSRGWRKLSGGEVDRSIPLGINANRGAVVDFVKHMEAKLSRKPVDATLDIDISDVGVRDGKDGRRLAAQEPLKRHIFQALTSTDASREMTAKVRRVEPKVTKDQVWERNPVVVTVSKSESKVRVFKRGGVVKSYGVVIGSEQYPTAPGQFDVQTKQVNPVWSVPNSSWAGGLAGQVIPGGAANNPLKARWIGFNGSSGFHGSTDLGAGAKSHGCVRMAPGDVIDLYDRVETGTPVLVA